jgi:hypothetical protein
MVGDAGIILVGCDLVMIDIFLETEVVLSVRHAS